METKVTLTALQQSELQELVEKHFTELKRPPGPWRTKLLLAEHFEVDYNHTHKTITGTEEKIGWLLLHL
jgi:hypothetical protein